MPHCTSSRLLNTLGRGRRIIKRDSDPTRGAMITELALYRLMFQRPNYLLQAVIWMFLTLKGPDLGGAGPDLEWEREIAGV
jgi:hypothetical protein